LNAVNSKGGRYEEASSVGGSSGRSGNVRYTGHGRRLWLRETVRETVQHVSETVSDMRTAVQHFAVKRECDKQHPGTVPAVMRETVRETVQHVSETVQFVQ